jgi:hypothetical protein
MAATRMLSEKRSSVLVSHPSHHFIARTRKDLSSASFPKRCHRGLERACLNFSDVGLRLRLLSILISDSLGVLAEQSNEHIPLEEATAIHFAERLPTVARMGGPQHDKYPDGMLDSRHSTSKSPVAEALEICGYDTDDEDNSNEFASRILIS